ncbi:MAG: DUF4377 domain-containing protein [Marinifilaceae bacterium]
MRMKCNSGVMSVLFSLLCLMACSDNGENGRTITGTKKYDLTVASHKVLGVISTCGNYSLDETYAVKKGSSEVWQSQGKIAGFEHEEGNQYMINVKETSYLDYSMGEPQWTEYEMSKLISKEKQVSADVPVHFIPDWYDPQNRINVRYAIEAENKELIEHDLKMNESIPWDYQIAFAGNSYALWDNEKVLIDCGGVQRTEKELTLFPESYKILPPEGDEVIRWHGEFCFESKIKHRDVVRKYDVFCGESVGASSTQKLNIHLYVDLTEYYKSKYPKSDVNAVVIVIEFLGSSLSYT